MDRVAELNHLRSREEQNSKLRYRRFIIVRSKRLNFLLHPIWYHRLTRSACLPRTHENVGKAVRSYFSKRDGMLPGVEFLDAPGFLNAV